MSGNDLSQGFKETPSVLVTGASGFVGSHICQMLSQHGLNVIAASRETAFPAAQAGSSIRHVRLSLYSSRQEWENALSTVRSVVHLAALVHQIGSAAAHETAYREVNVEGSRIVAEHAARCGVRQLIFMSSIKVNGDGGKSVIYRRSDTPSPQDAYGRSKWEAENTLRRLASETGMSLTIIRPPLVYGPGVRANFRRLIRLCALGAPLPFGSIDNRRSLIGVSNLGSFILLCLSQPIIAAGTWLVSDGDDLSTPELVRKIAVGMDKRARLIPVRPSLLMAAARIVGMTEEMNRLCNSLCIDLSATKEILRWSPPVSVEEEIARSVAHYVSRKDKGQ